jgi:hypothetical protein
MKRRESGKSARHARRDGWRAPLLTMLKYCRHKNYAEDRHREYQINENARLRQDGTFDHDSRTAQQIGREYCIPVFPQDIRLGRRLCDRGRWRQGAPANEL